jgi:type 1 glutamine amidotransferase
MNLDRQAGWLCSAVVLAWPLVMASTHAAEPPAPASRQAVEAVLAKARIAKTDGPLRRLTILLVADAKDHGPGEHDYPRWQSRWALLLGGSAASSEKAANLSGPDRPEASVSQGAEGVRVACVHAWPDSRQWETADLAVVFCYIAWNAERIEQVRRFLQRGGGLVLLHSATWTKPEPSAQVAAVVGVGGFQRYRHGTLALEIARPEHPICLGLPATIRLVDESYWPPTPLVGSEVQVLVGGKEQTAAGQGGLSVEPMFWTYERGKGRVFGCVPGHYSWTFDNPYFRLLVLRGMAWAACESPYRFDGLAMRSASVTEP